MRGEEWDVVIRVDGDRARVVLFGEIDMDARAPLLAEIDAAIAGGATAIEFDYRATSFCGSDCIGLMVHATRSNVRVSMRPTPVMLRAVEKLGLVEGLGIIIL